MVVRFTTTRTVLSFRGRPNRDRMLVIGTTWIVPMQLVPIITKVVSEFNSRSWRGALYTTLCYKVCQWLAAG